MSKEVKRYAERDIYEMDVAGNYYCRHVSAMTGEGLHSKSDIAAELGWRDMQIDALLAERDALKAVMKMVYDGLNARIDDAVADGRAVPVFDGIADLHDALQGEQP